MKLFFKIFWVQISFQRIQKTLFFLRKRQSQPRRVICCSSSSYRLRRRRGRENRHCGGEAIFLNAYISILIYQVSVMASISTWFRYMAHKLEYSLTLSLKVPLSLSLSLILCVSLPIFDEKGRDF